MSVNKLLDLSFKFAISVVNLVDSLVMPKTDSLLITGEEIIV